MKIDYITFRDAHNAGDNLIGYTAQRLIRGAMKTPVDYNVIHVVNDDYASSRQRNIVFGPGGIVTGSPERSEPDRLFLKHIRPELLKTWDREKRKIFFFGSGTNANPGYRDFTPASGKLLGELISISSRLYLRGSEDIAKISQYAREEDRGKLIFQPCPSVFLDRIFSIEPNKKDRVAVNFGFGKLSPEQARMHPLRRFLDYVRAQGLTPVLFANHGQDVNDAMVDAFGGLSVYNSPMYGKREVSREKEANRERAFRNLMHQDQILAQDFNGFRFAFGVRLHGWLPFTAFNTPAVFLNTRPIRKPMPVEYFGLPELSCPFMPQDADGVVDKMIQTLDYLVKNEDRIAEKIASERDRLFEITATNLAEMENLMEATERFPERSFWDFPWFKKKDGGRQEEGKFSEKNSAANAVSTTLRRMPSRKDFLVVEAYKGAPAAVIFSSVNANGFTFYKQFEKRFPDITRIYVRDPFDAWYSQGISKDIDSSEKLMSLICSTLDELSPAKWMSVGSSMGGYAALKLQTFRPATFCLAFSPQTILDSRLPHTPKSSVPSSDYDLRPELEALSLSNTALVFGAADFVDILNVCRIRWSGASLYPIADGDHVVVQELIREGLLDALISTFLSGGNVFDVLSEGVKNLDIRCFQNETFPLIERLVNASYLGAKWDIPPLVTSLQKYGEWAGAARLHARYLSASGDLAGAIEEMRRVCDLTPRSSSALAGLGTLLSKAGRTEEAISAYEDCLKLRGKYYAVMCQLAELYLSVGSNGRATKLLQEAMALRPRLGLAQSILRNSSYEIASPLG